MDYSFLPFGFVALKKQFAEGPEALSSADLIVELGVNRQVEVIVDFSDLSQVFILHLAARSALLAILRGVWEQYLVDNDVVDIDLLFGEFNRQSFGLVH